MCVCIVEGRADAISYKRESPTVPGPSVESRSCVSLPFSREKSRGGRSIGTLTVCVHVRSVTALEPVPAPVQSAAVFRDARSSSLSRDRVTFCFVCCRWGFPSSSSSPWSFDGRVQCPGKTASL